LITWFAGESHLLKFAKYIEQNPLKAGLRKTGLGLQFFLYAGVSPASSPRLRRLPKLAGMSRRYKKKTDDPRPSKTIDQLIINSPLPEPGEHWNMTAIPLFSRVAGRRHAGYVAHPESSKPSTIPASSLNFRSSTKSAARKCPGATRATPVSPASPNTSWITGAIPKTARTPPFFFCQLEAVETLIWLAEGPSAEKIGIDIPSDRGLFRASAPKWRPVPEKPSVMAMLIAWQVLNKVASPQDKRFSKNIFIGPPDYRQERSKFSSPRTRKMFYTEAT